MAYYISKVISGDFEETIARVTEALKEEGFGVLTDINITSIFKKKLDVEFRNYRILGACNPQFAHHALLQEDHVGTMLPCNVIIQEHEPGEIEVAAVDPIASMTAITNPDLQETAHEVRSRLERVVRSL